ncbi:MAG TPA: M15 family metallopeptidase [Candidatus Acidoferrum sp.]|nr:M15 family metallopeptidase [Candidatus Acidoferrum sp.]
MKKFLSLLLALSLLLLPVSAFDAEELSPNRVLINPACRVEVDYIPPDLVPLTSVGLKVSLAAISLDRQAADFLKFLVADMSGDGITNYIIVSGYRQFSSQERLFTNKVNSYIAQGYSEADARAAAATSVAVPGTSEHQSGYAIDMSNTAQGGTLSGNVAKSSVGVWMLENAQRFGFTLRYPEDKTDITGIIYEPWHYRYVGFPHSQILYDMGLCLEEYVDYLRGGKAIDYTDDKGIRYRIEYFASEDAIPETGDGESVAAVGDGGYIVTSVRHDKSRTMFRWM